MSLSNKTSILAAWIIFCAVAAQGQISPEANTESSDEIKAQEKILSDLSRAEKLYQEALAHLQEGHFRSSEKSFKKAFSLLVELILEEGATEKIKPEFDAMIDKVRRAELSEAIDESATSSLDVPPEALEGNVLRKDRVGLLKIQEYTIRVDENDQLVQKYLVFYTQQRKAKVEEALARSGRYKDLVLKVLNEMKLPRELFYLLMTESEFKVNAYSRAGAAGLWQLMPATARKLGLKVNYWIDERFDPEASTKAALKYLKELYEMFDDWHLALAAYNRGEYGIGRDLMFVKATDFSVLANHKATPKETEHFVPKFMACVLLADNPKQYDLSPDYESSVPYDEVVVVRPLDLQIAAKAAETSEEVLRALNPAIRAWCTPINYPDFKLRIPNGSKDTFLANLERVKDWNPTRGFVSHKIRKGDTLTHVARKYKTSVAAIMKDNKLFRPNLLRSGQILKIQPGRGYFHSR